MSSYGYVFIGNCGSGKTTIVNTIAQEHISSNELRLEGQSTTRQLFRKDLDSTNHSIKNFLVDTRGLNEETIIGRKESLEQLNRLLAQKTNLKIFFVVTLQHGLPRFEDVLLIDMVLSAFQRNDWSVNNQFQIIVNKCDESIIEQSRNNWPLSSERIQILLGKRHTSHVLYIPTCETLVNGNAFMHPDRQKIWLFVRTSKTTKFNHRPVRNIPLSSKWTKIELKKKKFLQTVKSFQSKFQSELGKKVALTIGQNLPCVDSPEQETERRKTEEDDQASIASSIRLAQLSIPTKSATRQKIAELEVENLTLKQNQVTLKEKILNLENENEQLKEDNIILFKQLEKIMFDAASSVDAQVGEITESWRNVKYNTEEDFYLWHSEIKYSFDF